MSIPQSWFRNLTLYSLVSAVCPLIPIPILDDYLLGKIRRHQVRELARDGQLRLSPLAVRILAGSERPLGPMGCFVGAILGAFWKMSFYLLRRIVRKILFFLMLKEAVDVSSETFHQGFLLSRALLELPPGSDLDPTEAWRLRLAVTAACEQLDTRPVQQVLRRSLRGSRALIAWVFARRGQGVAARSRRWSDLVDGVSEALWEQEGYLRAFESHFRLHLEGSAPATI